MDLTGPIVDVGNGVWRTGAWGIPGEVATSIRLSSKQQMRPPFTVTMDMRPMSPMDPPRFNWAPGKPSDVIAGYDPGIVVQPMYGTDATPAAGENENVLVRFGSKGQTTAAVSAELRDERPLKPYGVRTGYVSRDRRSYADPWDGRWHRLRIEVPSFDSYAVFWDGELLARVVEQHPATIVDGQVRVGLRLDFADVYIRNARLEGDEMATTYPDGYRTRLITMAEMKAEHGPKMHPEFRRRFFRWIESMRGLVGVGGGWRDTQPDKPGFAPDGKSFHQYQHFASGIRAYCAVDLVCRNGDDIHRAPTWAESETAPDYHLHTFITGEPWHIQPIEIRGHGSWVDAGRPDPVADVLIPGDVKPPTDPPPPPPTPEDDDMPLFIAQTDTGGFHVIDGVWRFSPARADVFVNMHAGVGRPVLDFATGNPVRSLEDVRVVDAALIRGVAYNVREA